MLQEVAGDCWYYRSQDQVSDRVDGLFEIYGGWPCVRIEVQLLYKSKGAQSKDARDFDACLPYLDTDRRGRLSTYLRAAYPHGHEWLNRLASPQQARRSGERNDWPTGRGTTP